ncbi:MAG: PDZ domain-containing protein [Planctomycetota bacterium]|jgi:C-terminal processing protease CtpA/Prc
MTRRGPVAVVLLLALAATAVAQAPPRNADPDISDLVSQLDDESYLVRERATKLLLESPCNQSALYDVLSSAALSLEQRHRLVRVSQQRLLSIPRGALGISMPPFRRIGRIEEPIPVEVIALIPGLPAERLLRIGDIITHIDGQPLMHQEELRNYVQLRRPGDVVKLTIRRARIGEDGMVVRDPNGDVLQEEVEIDLALGSVERLREEEDGRNRGASDSEIYTERVGEARKIADEYSVTPPRVRFPD